MHAHDYMWWSLNLPNYIPFLTAWVLITVPLNISSVAIIYVHVYTWTIIYIQCVQNIQSQLYMKSTKVLNPRRCILRHEKYACAYTRIRMEKWPTVRMAVQRRECWISATEWFQRKPHKFFDLRCPLST